MLALDLNGNARRQRAAYWAGRLDAFVRGSTAKEDAYVAEELELSSDPDSDIQELLRAFQQIWSDFPEAGKYCSGLGMDHAAKLAKDMHALTAPGR